MPVENTHQSNTEEAFSYDKEKYREMKFDAAETVLGYFGFDRTVYGNKMFLCYLSYQTILFRHHKYCS